MFIHYVRRQNELACIEQKQDSDKAEITEHREQEELQAS